MQGSQTNDHSSVPLPQDKIAYRHGLHRRGQIALRTLGALVLAGLAWTTQAQTYYPVEELLVSGKTVVGEELRYPTSGAPKITVAIVTVAPGSKASFHRHPVPLVAYILEGELTVNYGEKGVKTYRKGDALIEAMDVSHRGTNEGSEIVRLLAVYIGAQGSANTVLEK